MLRSLAAASTAFLVTGQALACSCMAPGDFSQASAEKALANYEVVEGRLASSRAPPRCESDGENRWYQTYTVAVEDGRMLKVRQAAQNFDGCQPLSSATCGTVLPQQGRYFLEPLANGEFRYPTSCALLSAEAAYQFLASGNAPDADQAPDPCGE